MRAGFADAPALHPFLAAEQLSAKESARREHDRPSCQRRPFGEFEPFDASVIRQSQRRRLAFDNGDAIFFGEQFLDCLAIEFAIRLDPWPCTAAPFDALSMR